MNYQNLPFIDQLFYLDQTPSTQLYAKKIIVSRKAQGNFIVISNEQSQGLGRSEKQWYSPKGGLWITIGLKGFDLGSSFTIFSGICLHKSLQELYPELNNNLKIKWPNDLFFKNRKIAGIITTSFSSYPYCLNGIGINTNNTDFPVGLDLIADSLKNILNKSISNDDLLRLFLEKLFTLLPEYLENKLSNYLTYFQKYSYLINKNVILETPYKDFEGVVKGLNKDGAILLMLRKDFVQPFLSGSISLKT